MSTRPRLPFLIPGVFTVLCSTAAVAGEMTVQARVVSVEPLREAVVREEVCAPRPSGNASLAGLLAWDLGLNCAQHTVGGDSITGYRVSYEWDNRIMSRVVAEAPGSSIPLRIRLD